MNGELETLIKSAVGQLPAISFMFIVWYFEKRRVDLLMEYILQGKREEKLLENIDK